MFLSRIGFLEEYAKTAKANVTVLQMTLGRLLKFISCLTADQVQQHWFQKPRALEWSYAHLAAVRKQLNWPAVYFSPGSVPENNSASMQSCICCSESYCITPKPKQLALGSSELNTWMQLKWHSMHHNNTDILNTVITWTVKYCSKV